MRGLQKYARNMILTMAFSYLLVSTVHPAYSAATFSAALVCPQKVIMRIKMFADFCNPLRN